MELKETYTEEEIANELLKYTISENAFINDKKDAKKAIAHYLNILKNNVHYLFEDNDKITQDDIDLFFPFLNVDSKEYTIPVLPYASIDGCPSLHSTCGTFGIRN